jgi:N-acetyl sugar amidotransferase
MQYCVKCVYPGVSATPLTFDDDGVCSGCRVSSKVVEIDWDQRLGQLKRLASRYQSDDNYDVVVPVSGGKDSYWQTHVAIHELGLKPLLVTYHGNNYLSEGEYNLNRMREVFDCDHIIMRPGTDVLIKMNRLGFKLQGDMNWHAHCGIFSFPIQAAVRFKIPLILWGEHGFMDLGGMYSYSDYVEFTAKHRKEHALRGYDWHNFTDEGLDKLGRPDLKEGLKEKDLLWAKYPNDEEIDELGVRGIYLSNYMKWEPAKHAKLMEDEYGWQASQRPFDRTYRTMSNLDDMHENGIHDYLKFIKFGYGRATDHSCKDVRAGIMSREEAVEIVRKYDAVKSSDLERWLEYVDMSEDEFDYICDTFRDPRVWWIEDGQWWKENVWGSASSYGHVHLSGAEVSKYMRAQDGS